MVPVRTRFYPIWRRTASLSWPVAIEQALDTSMRTVDVVVTGLFSPAAVAAVGLADLYGQLPMRVGHGLGAGSIALSSQDTGRGATEVRNRAITQAICLGFLVGVPFVVLGFLLGDFAIAVLGAESDVVAMGGLYLAIIFAAAPMRITSLVVARALQGTGDTRTPMYISASSNALNIVLTVALGLGVWFVPSLGIAGVAIATAISRTVEATTMILVISYGLTELEFARPRDAVITRQLLAISIPNFAEGMSTSIASFPFNAIVLTFGTEVNAAYHIARRIYQQVSGPLYRSIGVASSIIIGQTLGEGDVEAARFSGFAMVILGIAVQCVAGIIIFVGADHLVALFTSDPTSMSYAADFTRVYATSMVFFGIFTVYAGGLHGAGDTRTPFYARLLAEFGFMLGLSYVAGVVLGFGLYGVYAGMVLCYVCRAFVVTVGFLWGNWADKASSRMADRTETAD